MQENIWNDKNLIKILSENGVVIMPTDTIYGIVGKALEKNTVERIYKIKKRNPNKPCIILIGDIKELEKFGIILSKEKREILEKYWFTLSEVERPRAVSIILDCADNNFEYLHRGTKTLAFRLPTSQLLRDLLLQTGPLIAPSANPEARLPSKNIKDAKKYFGNSVDLYVDGGELKNKASKLIKLNNDGSIIVLRE
ncbi:MAG: L-threonylcarbamoyladenylate synthase [Candidatus Nomurabacteria bacterium]|nr:L-threonylcarbamoyladenylate synthase [Candidatus Nomurabacteria bacterium]